MRKSAPLILLCLMTSIICVQAQSYRMHSVYIFSFTRHVVWPDESSQGDFEIFVLGDSPITEELRQGTQGKKVGDRSIKITRINSVAEIRKCNILFIPAAHSAQLADVMGKVGVQPVLVITEEPGLGTKGSHINFIMKDGKLAFELNQAAASKHNLKISNTLTSMAILI
ncbi:DUF4154 domain-containing protein [Fulvivirgaceae bacterium PWU4]|uniref:DUF4154 domain-containing protein n=1 Tax=Chryseosolibacter histidini TaxID=2782349 RepID=A0AAP2DIE4_9BACT|nr:YfiR family protein [Chryseosolibacter histidini]MBT1696890.1 DUF4154 domain-containing protein [Chryseosolibacter histidini]